MGAKAVRNPFADGLPTLGRIDIPADRLAILFNCDRRYQESMLQRLIFLNRKSFEFLDITASIAQRESKLYLSLASSRYVGTVPLFSPADGKCVCDLKVVGRYNEEIGEIISLLPNTLKPEYCDDLQLHDHSDLKASLFLECCKYVDKYIEADKYNWIKFSRVTRSEPSPRGHTDWNRYAQRSASNPAQALTFDNSYSFLSTDHREWHRLNYVLQLALAILSKHTTPIKIRAAYNQKIESLARKLRQSVKLKVDEMRINSNDPAVVKELKRLGNIILNDDRKTHMAWKIDYSEFFERYVQYIITKVAAQRGGQSYNNTRLPVRSSNRPAWGLLYLEPDIIFLKDNLKVIIDAKYKSHIFNWDSGSDELKDTFRQDLHQVLAYSSFSSADHKSAALIYPFTAFISRRLHIHDPNGANAATVHLIGIPISKTTLPQTITALSSLLV